MVSVNSWRRAWGWGAIMLAGLLSCTGQASPLNSPYPDGAESTNTFFSAFFGSSPKTADPTRSFSANETAITYNAYEPLLRYHYLKRPFELEGLAAESVPVPVYKDAQGRELPADADPSLIAESVYDIKIRRGMRFAPHPAFAKSPDDSFMYWPVDFAALPDVARPLDFPSLGTREVNAHDFVYAIKRLASPRNPSPGFTSIGSRVIGLSALADQIKQADRPGPDGKVAPWLDLRQFDLPGAQAIDDHTLRLRVVGKDPQIKYWMAMTFFAPIPWEAERFYTQPGMAERNLSLNRWPAGAGPYMLTEFALNRGFTLERNPNYWGAPYPCEGTPADQARGLLDDCGKPTPFIDKAIYLLEKETVPLMGKFLQGYYDAPVLDRSEYGAAMMVAAGDTPRKAEEFQEKGLAFSEASEQSVWHMGFNWVDPVVGRGDTPEQQERNRKLRLAMSIVLDWEEYVTIFHNGMGSVAQSPIPPGIFGRREGVEGVNPEVFDIVDGRARLKSLDTAKRLLAEAGYPGGRDARTGQPLVLNYDSMTGGGSSPSYDWYKRKLGLLGIQLDLRASDFNRFQDKLNQGAAQVFMAGWVADYPDAENFLNLLYGPGAKVSNGGENSVNYSNPEYDALYRDMATLEDGPEKQAIIDKMVDIVRHDAPWSFGYHQGGAAAFHKWVGNAAPSGMVRNSLQYMKVDAALRTESIAKWNRPVWWPMGVLAVLIAVVLWLSWRTLRRTQRRDAFGRDSTATVSGKEAP